MNDGAGRWWAGAKAAAGPSWYLLVVPLAGLVFIFGDVGGFLKAPAWIPVSIMAVALPVRFLVFARWDTRTTAHLHYGAAVHSALVTAVIYSTGWGPMLALGYLIVSQELIWANGSRVALPATVWSLIGIGAGQLAIAADLAPSAVSAADAHTIAGLAGVGCVFGIYLMRTTAADREAANESERTAREQLAAILDQVPEAIVVVDADGTLRYLSRTAVEMFGHQPGDHLGAAGLNDVHDDDRAVMEDFFARLMTVPGSIDSTEVRVFDRHGQMRWVHVIARNLMDLPGEALVATLHDITERRRLEEERAALDRAREDFLSIAAHELRTPLTTLVGAARFAESDDHATEIERAEALDLIRRQGARLDELLGKLLDLSALVSGATSLDLEAVRVRPLVDSIARGILPPPGAALTVVVDPEVTVSADRVRLGQVVTNLVANAYAHGGPAVYVRAEQEGNAVCISVVDDGDGVRPDLVARLFEPFIRGDDGTAGTGAGLGLAICARLVRAMGGDISYERALPRGASFSITLPAAPLAASATPEGADATEA